MSATRIIIIGAGPTGLGAAWRLHELGYTNWDLFEATDHAGGLASSTLDPHGFTWDMGVHVLHSHYQYFNKVMLAALGDAWSYHRREAWIWMRDRFIPYPLQNNLWRLPDDDLYACLAGLRERVRMPQSIQRPSFHDWLLEHFGQGLCDVFMLPYNKKIWGVDPAFMDSQWMHERVAHVDLERVRANISARRDDTDWGPNAIFQFPTWGGTGTIWSSLSRQLPFDRQHYSRTLAHVNTAAHMVHFTDGSCEEYDYLISTIPLDALLRMTDLTTKLADAFVRSSTHIIGLGLNGRPPAALQDKSWIYFPERQQPFYRATVFSNYASNVVARPGHQWSLIAEVSETAARPVDSTRIISATVDAMVACGFIEAPPVSRWHRRLEYGYPTPWLGRDTVLGETDTLLRQHHVFSRGRFGAWKYEVSNQDHSLMQGVEAVDHILFGDDETTYHGAMHDSARRIL